jgi:pimeloyl-ACP methyl ester carboxylesterase
MIDQRGHGASDSPHDVSEYEWPLLVDDVSCVLDQLGIQAASMFGYSAGSYVAMGMAMTIPDRVSRLILGGASPKWAGLRPQTGELLATEGMEGFVRVFFEANGPLPTAQRNKLLANDPLALRASLSASRCTPSPEMLQAFTKPCLLLVGEADPRLADSREMASQFANAQLVTFPELNHVQTFERGDLVVPHLKAFLANS